MNNSYLRTLIATAIIIALQVWVFNPMAIFRLATPMIYPMLLFLVPMSRGPIALTIYGFMIGSLIDYFGFTPGLHATAMTLTAFVRYYFVQISIDAQDNIELLPMPSTLGSRSYILLVEILLVHHLVLYLLSSGLHADILYSLSRAVAGYLASYILASMALLGIGLRP